MSRRSRRLTLPPATPDAPTAPGEAGNRPTEAIPADEAPKEASDASTGPEMAMVGEGAPVTLRMRLSPGLHAVSAGEAEVLSGGARIAGGSGTFEFNLWTETWVDITVLRP